MGFCHAAKTVGTSTRYGCRKHQLPSLGAPEHTFSLPCGWLDFLVAGFPSLQGRGEESDLPFFHFFSALVMVEQAGWGRSEELGEGIFASVT